MPTALTQTEHLRAHVNQASKAQERPVLVSKDLANDTFIQILNLILFLNCNHIL